MSASETSVSPAAAASASASHSTGDATPSLSIIQRAVLVFTRPAQAWQGLREHGQWWFPFLLVPAINLVVALVIYRRAHLPMILESLEERVANGEMTPDQLAPIEQFYSGPAGLMITGGSVAVMMLLFLLVVALLIWFTIGFVLGAPFRYRLALEVATWSSLVTLPGMIVGSAIGWARENMRGVHIGFGVLLPEPEAGDRLLLAAGVFLDLIGPFGIWHVAVAALGAAYLSGLSRKPVAWALGALYLVLGLFAAALAALVPGGV